MGMFDEVLVRCPGCGHASTLQSKAGPCHLNTWPLHEAPPEVAASLDGETVHCEAGCGMTFAVRVHVCAHTEPLGRCP